MKEDDFKLLRGLQTNRWTFVIVELQKRNSVYPLYILSSAKYNSTHHDDQFLNTSILWQPKNG